MYRVYILVLLAIGLSAFAVDSSQSILQAKKIADTSMALNWTAIPEATKYKVFYDETDLLDPVSPNPLLSTEFITKNEGDITKLTAMTEYTIVVHGYTADGNDIGKTIPLHAKTSSAIPQMNISRDPVAINDTTLEFAFSRPIDVKNAQITLKNTKNKKVMVVQEIKSSEEDLRIVLVVLKNKMELSVPYELTLKKIVSLDGTELPPENRVPLKVVYNGELPPLAGGVVPPPSIIDVEPEKPFTEPVAIDSLPQTGPAHIVFLALLSACIVFFLQKKLSKRA
ncbi:hypothetical protein KA057_01325 [Candidatus Gracilibacteria bacterium]|nr:hypothetical protein [Candidatus Gracilibacteria bacterium]